jgi:hypothetical protein
MKDLKLNLLRYSQRQQLKNEIAQAEQSLTQAKAEDAGGIRSSRNKTQKQLDEGSPVALTGKEKDTLYALEKKLADRIKQNMPTEESMRKNSVGTVDHHIKWEKANKPLIRMWKNVRIQLNQDSDDRDLANVERLRPAGQMDRMRTDAQIPGKMTFTSVPEENWPFEKPTNTALEQAKQRDYREQDAEAYVEAGIAELDEKELNEVEADLPSECTPEQKVILVNRLAHARQVLKEKREAAKKLEADLAANDLQADPA